MQVRCISIITILYVWNVTANYSGEIRLQSCRRILSILQDFDFYYNFINLVSSDDDDWFETGKEYADQILKREDYIKRLGGDQILKSEDDTKRSGGASKRKQDIMNHYFYFSSTLEHMYPVSVTCQKIIINISVTIMAYEAALNFRICTLYYSVVNPEEKEIINACEELFEYMEWFFSFLFYDKVEAFCKMEINEKIGIQRKRKHSKQSTEENFTTDLCKLLHGVNLNFLKKKKNIVQTEFLQDEKAGVYKSHLSQNFYENFSNRLQSLYNKSKFDVYKVIQEEILELHTNDFEILMQHLNSVIYGKGRLLKTDDVNQLKPTYNFSTAIWSKIKELKEIKDFPSNELRQTYSGHGDEMLRSNAIDILRVITTIRIQEILLLTIKKTTDKERKTKKKAAVEKAAKQDGEQKLRFILKKTGSDEPVLKCSITSKNDIEENGFFHYLTVAKSTEELFLQNVNEFH